MYPSDFLSLQRLEFDTDLQRIQRQRTPDSKVIQSVEDEGMWNTLMQALPAFCLYFFPVLPFLSVTILALPKREG